MSDDSSEGSSASVEVALREVLSTMERHDIHTYRHSYAVGAWSRRLAAALGLSKPLIVFVERCGVLHDIGKLHIPEAILIKSGPLSTEEWACMMTHSAAGAEILRAIPVLSEYAVVAEVHHERLDGRGYPNRLPSSQIPLEARIVCVADAFDAMIGVRSYRAPVSRDEAIAELRRFRGSQFDGDVVDCIVDLVQRRHPGERSFGIN